MKTVAIALIAASASAMTETNVEYNFVRYLAKNGKNYLTSQEYAFRFALFAKTDAFIQTFNSDSENSSMKVGHNKFSDWTEEEKAKLRGSPDMFDID